MKQVLLVHQKSFFRYSEIKCVWIKCLEILQNYMNAECNFDVRVFAH